MTRGDEDVEGAPKVFRHPRGGLRKKRWARRGAPKIVYTSKPAHDIIIQIGW